LNKLLARQLRRNEINYETLPETFRSFIDDVNLSYQHHETDRTLIERSIELNSQEMIEANKRLEHVTERQRHVLENLRSLILSLQDEDDAVSVSEHFAEADIVTLSDFLAKQIRRKKEAEDTITIYKMAINSTGDGVVISDPLVPDNPVIFCNPAFLRTTGYTLDEVLGRNCRFLQGTERDQPGLQIIREALAKQTSCHVRIKNYKKSGEMFWSDFRLSPIFDKDNVLKYYVGIQSDVTADVEREKFLANVSIQRKDLLYTAEEILGAQTEEDVVKVIMDRLSNILPFDTASIYTVQEHERMLRPIALLGENGAAPNLDEWSIPMGSGIIGSIIDAKKGELVNDAHRDPRSIYPKGAVIKQEHLIVQPLRSGDDVWGAFIINRMSDQRFTSDEYEIVQFLSSYASLALQNIVLVKKLKDSEQSQRTILETISDGVISIDHRGTIFYANEGISKIFGYAASEISGKNISLLVPAGLRSRHHKGFNRYNEIGKRHLPTWHAVALPGLHKDGHELPLEISFGESTINGQRIFTGIIRDITERKKAEALLSATTTRLTSLIQTIQAGVLVEDETRHISLINGMFCTMFGIPAEPKDLLGSDCSTAAEQSKGLFADPEGFVSTVTVRLRNQTIVTNEELSLADGRTFERDYIPIFVNHVYKGHMWLYRDITARKQIEIEMEKLARFPNENPNPIIRVDKEFKILYTNQPGKKMLREVGETREDTIPPSWKPIVESTLLKGKTTEFEIVAIEGTPVYLTHFVPVASSGYVNLYSRDITERKIAEWEANKAKRIAEESMRAKQDFLAKMSHELRTPMNAVLGLTNLMMNTGLSHEQESLVHGIKSSGKNLLVIINDILDLAKIEAGKMTIDSTDFDLVQQLQNIKVAMQPLADQKRIGLKFDVDPAFPPMLIGDPVRLGQVIINLLSNAMKFTEHGGVSLSVSVDGTTGQNSMIIAVTDTGIGIPAEKQGTIFESFSQASHDISVRFGGTGLGLTIVHQLVTLMQGEISVQSMVGKGSTFTVRLPLRISSRSRDTLIQQENIRTTFVPLNGKILLVEDNPTNQLVAVKTMQMWNLTVDVASDGFQALSLLETSAYDLILMDIQMPGIDGFETTKRIRTELPEPKRTTPVIAMTASVMNDPEGRALSSGMQGYISKPFELQDLYQKISQYVDQGTVPVPAAGAATVLPNNRFIHLNTSFLETIAPDSPEFIAEMLQLFETNTPVYLRTMREALLRRDFALLKRTAHTMKPTGAYIGINSMKPIVAEIELLAEQEKETGAIEHLLTKLDVLCNEIIHDIYTWHTFHKK